MYLYGLPPAQNCFAFVPAAVRPGEPAQKPNVRAVVERIVEVMRAAEAEVTMHERIVHALTLDETCESLDPIQRRGATR